MKDLNVSYHWIMEPPPAGSGVWIPLAGRLTSYGESRYHSLPDYFCPHVIASGHGRIELEGATYNIAPGDMFTLWPGSEILYHDFPDTPWQFYYFHLSGDRMKEYVQALGFSAMRQVLRPRRPDDALAEFDLIWQTMRDKPTNGQYTVLSRMFALAGLCADERDKPSPSATLVEQTLLLISTAPNPAMINVNEICDRLGVSRATLYRKFTAQMHQSPIDYIVSHRLRIVRELLRHSSKTVNEISTLAGFNSEKYLLRQFKQRFGLTPTEFRNQSVKAES